MTNQTFTFETVACLLAVLEKNKIVLGNKEYALMAQLDGQRSQHGFQHQFRKVKARARELQQELSGTKGNANTSTVKKTATKQKTDTKSKATATQKRKQDEEDDTDDASAAETQATQSKASKKVKMEPVVDDEDGAAEFFRFVVKEHMSDA